VRGRASVGEEREAMAGGEVDERSVD